MALYDDEAFFGNYAQMARSRGGLEAAGEWPQFSALLPQDMSGLDVLDLGCGYGWHCRYAAQRGALRAGHRPQRADARAGRGAGRRGR